MASPDERRPPAHFRALRQLLVAIVAFVVAFLVGIGAGIVVTKSLRFVAGKDIYAFSHWHIGFEHEQRYYVLTLVVLLLIMTIVAWRQARAPARESCFLGLMIGLATIAISRMALLSGMVQAVAIIFAVNP